MHLRPSGTLPQVTGAPLGYPPWVTRAPFGHLPRVASAPHRHLPRVTGTLLGHPPRAGARVTGRSAELLNKQELKGPGSDRDTHGCLLGCFFAFSLLLLCCHAAASQCRCFYCTREGISSVQTHIPPLWVITERRAHSLAYSLPLRVYTGRCAHPSVSASQFTPLPCVRPWEPVSISCFTLAARSHDST